MVSKPKPKCVQNEEITQKSMKEFLKFFKIDLKSDEEMNKMSKQKRKQYENRLKRWDSLIQSHIEYEIYRSLTLFKHFNEMVVRTKEMVSKIRSEEDFDTKYDDDYKKKLKRTESEANAVLTQLSTDRKIFDDIYIPYKQRKAEQMIEELKIKEEMQIKEELEDNDADIQSETDSEVCIKEEYYSEDEYFSVKDEDSIDYKKAVKKEIEFDVKPNIKREIKTEIKSEIKSEFKYEIKEEFKVEVKDEKFEPRIKEEIISSDDEEYID